MPEQRLRDTLERLHEELAAHPDLDGETAGLLRDVLADITALLEQRRTGGEQGQAGPDESLSGRLQSATSDLQTMHPRLTTAVAQLADALSGMGI